MISKDAVAKTLRDEETRRRAEAKKREQQIVELLFAQKSDAAVDRIGALWAEQQFAALAHVDERPTDTEARFVPDFRNPERIAMMKELWLLVTATVRAAFGEQALRLFIEWLRGATVAELAITHDRQFSQLLWQIRSCVAACRARVGTDPAIFPFQETGGKLARRVNARRAHRRMMENKSEPANMEARVYLTDAERVMKLDPLWQHLRSKGHDIARVSAWKAKKRGWFYPDFQPGYKHTRVELTAEERQAPSRFLAERFGISLATAQVAKKRGWFALDPIARKRVRVPEDRTVPENLPNNQRQRVSLTDEDRQLSRKEVSERFGISKAAAGAARKRGWFEIQSTNRIRVEAQLKKLGR